MFLIVIAVFAGLVQNVFPDAYDCVPEFGKAMETCVDAMMAAAEEASGMTDIEAMREKVCCAYQDLETCALDTIKNCEVAENIMKGMLEMVKKQTVTFSCSGYSCNDSNTISVVTETATVSTLSVVTDTATVSTATIGDSDCMMEFINAMQPCEKGIADAALEAAKMTDIDDQQKKICCAYEDFETCALDAGKKCGKATEESVKEALELQKKLVALLPCSKYKCNGGNSLVPTNAVAVYLLLFLGYFLFQNKS